MKNLILIGILSVTPAILKAQSVERSIISNGGNSFSSANFSADWTIGEIVTTQASSGNNIFTQGFHQYTSSTLNTRDLNAIRGLKCFPNPASDQVQLTLEGNNRQALINLYDAGGKLITSGNWNTGNAYNLNLSNCAQGIYTLQIIVDGKINVIKLSRI